MNFLAITQATADWILGKPSLIDEIYRLVAGTSPEIDVLRHAEFVEGPFRASATPEASLLAIWNVDYLSGTGEEPWGFIKLTGPHGLDNVSEISREVLERCFYVINQRLQGLLIDGALIHRAYPNGSHTCLAGRGSHARQNSICYYESSIEARIGGQRSLVCVGPAYDLNSLTQTAVSHSDTLPNLVKKANGLIAPGRKRAIIDSSAFKQLQQSLSAYSREEITGEYRHVEIATTRETFEQQDRYRAVGLTYEDWLRPDSPLTEIQRRILTSDAIERHPLRIVGPGGSGKTLLMQLLALRRLERAKSQSRPVKVLYIAHNAAMADTVGNRFAVLEGAISDLRSDDRTLDISTLAEYGRRQLGLDYNSVIDPDAYEAKVFQFGEVTTAIHDAMTAMPEAVAESLLFNEVNNRPELLPVLALLVTAEISTAIKGHGLQDDKKRYVQSERRLSRLHGVLTQSERELIYHAYERYHAAVFETLEVLDTDDIALSLLGRLRTPIWQLKRRDLGYDYVFIDETQLFNENERRVFPLLTNAQTGHVPIALALDEAQEVFGQSTAGIATLGIPDIANESLSSIHRSTHGIVRLAFFVIQRSTDLFGPDFPDFTGIADQMESDEHPLATPPRLEIPSGDQRLGRFVVRKIREFRKANIRQIAVICHAEQYWDVLLAELRGTDLPLHVILERGMKLPIDQPIVVLTRPLHVGGQEFDAVILVGLEQGLVPPKVTNNDALAAAVEQQAIREMYLAITRARYRLTVVLTPGASPTSVVGDAEKAGLIGRRAADPG